jgi:serine protease Do
MKKVLKIIGAGLIIFIIGGIGGVVLNYMLFSKAVADPELANNPIIKALDQQRVQIIKTTEKVVVAETESIADIASRASTSVVYVESVDELGNTIQGNGIIVSSDGLIATTIAVVPKNSEVQYIKLADGSVYTVKEVVFDDYYNIAFLRIEASNLSTISFANSDDARSGKRIIAISRSRNSEDAQFAVGGFLSHDNTFSISSPTSDFLQGTLIMDLTQTSFERSVGSPAVDFHGNMVGLISQKIDMENQTKEYYALASNDIYTAFEEFINKADVESEITQKNLLGVNYHLISKLDVHKEELAITAGAVIDVPTGSHAKQQAFTTTLAARSGLRQGDIIVTVNDETIDMENNLSRLLHKHRNDQGGIALKVLRGEELMTIKLFDK